MALQNTETSSSTVSASASNPFFSIPPSTLKKSTGHKLQYVYEINYDSENPNIQDMQYPDVNLYKAFTKPKPSTSFFKSVKAFLNPPQKLKEYIEVTGFDEHPIPSGEQERFITLKIPSHLQRQGVSLQSLGCSHLHVAAIQLALTFHNRKGLPVATRIALLDSRFKNYQHACLGIVETTLNSGTVFVTLFPNFTMSLQEKTLSSAFLVQIQIVGAPMDPGLIQATLHSQMAYRVQDHVFGLPLTSSGDFPLIQVDSQNVPTTIHIPTNISREELVSVLPEIWVRNFENRPTEEQLRRARRNQFIGNADGSVTIRAISLERK